MMIKNTKIGQKISFT